MKDLVSVIVLINDIESYISSCLDSILKQTYKNLEILLIYKKTEDNSLKICEYYKDLDKRIEIITVTNSNKKNLKNIGISHAKGKYITIIDGGDYVTPNYVDYMLKLIRDEKTDMVCTGRYFTDTKPTKIEKVEVYTGKEIMANYMHMKFKSHFYAKLYKKELFQDIIYPNVTYYDDFITTYKIFDKANKIVVSTAENYCLVLNKVYFKNKITDSDRMKKIGSCFDMLTFMEEHYPELEDYCKTKICFEAIDLFRDVKDNDYRKQLYSYIKLYRRYALRDTRIEFSKKMLCIRSILGYHLMKLSFCLEELLKKPIN